MFEKILVPIDGSEHSVKAIKLAAEIAKKHNSRKLVLVNVYSVTVPYGFSGPGGLEVNAETYQSMSDAAHAHSDEILAEGKEVASAEEIPAGIIETLSIEGHVIEEIVKTAKEGGFSLIVLGHRGKSRFETLLGSVSHGVTSHATCPVLVVR